MDWSQQKADREWFRRVAAAGFDIEKRGGRYVAVDASGRALRYFSRRYEAEAFISKRIGTEMRGIEERICA